MKRLFLHLKKYRLQSVLGPAFKLLEASFELLVPLIVAAIIDNGIPAEDNGYILRMCGILALLALLGLAASLTAQYFAAKAATGFASSVRHELMGSISKMSYTELDRAGASTLITRMTADVDSIQSGLNLTLRLLLRSPFVVFGAMIMAFLVDRKAALTFTVIIPALSVVVFGIMLLTIPLYRRVASKLDRVTAKTRGNIAGTRVIRAFCREDAEKNEFEQRNGELTAVSRLAGGVSALMNPITTVMINFAIIFLIKSGALRVEAGLLTQGGMVALYNYMTQILVELIKLADLIINITRALASAGRVSAVIEGAEGQKVYKSVVGADFSKNEDIPAVEFRNVSLRYSGAGGDSLKHINFSVSKGETVGVIGGTGSGKSSLVNLIPRFYDATEGEVLVNGKAVGEYEPDALRSQIGVVPQRITLFSGTIRENLLFGRNKKGEMPSDEKLMSAIKTAQAEDVISVKEEGLDFVIGEGGSGLSGGQRQRLTIARALVRDPEILILDDSSSALDYATDARLRASLSNLPSKPNVFIVSQRVASVRHADKIIVLDDGEAVGMGRHEELLGNCSVYREICESQSAAESGKEASANG